MVKRYVGAVYVQDSLSGIFLMLKLELLMPSLNGVTMPCLFDIIVQTLPNLLQLGSLFYRHRSKISQCMRPKHVLNA